MATDKPTIRREDFIKKLTACGLTYQQAETAYSAFIAVLEDGISSRSKINFSKVGALDPKELHPRQFTMGFRRDRDGIHSEKRQYTVGTRIKYQFRVYKAFGRAHGLCA